MMLPRKFLSRLATGKNKRKRKSEKKAEKSKEIEFDFWADRKMSKNVNFSRISTCQWVKQLRQLKLVHISLVLLQFLLQGYW